MFAAAAYQAGQLFGLAILVLIGIGFVRTFTRDDLTIREKMIGRRKPK